MTIRTSASQRVVGLLNIIIVCICMYNIIIYDNVHSLQVDVAVVCVHVFVYYYYYQTLVYTQ